LIGERKKRKRLKTRSIVIDLKKRRRKDIFSNRSQDFSKSQCEVKGRGGNLRGGGRIESFRYQLILTKGGNNRRGRIHLLHASPTKRDTKGGVVNKKEGGEGKGVFPRQGKKSN